MRLEGWGGPWFETRAFGALLTMRPQSFVLRAAPE
jgi:hypothetical protein